MPTTTTALPSTPNCCALNSITNPKLDTHTPSNGTRQSGYGTYEPNAHIGTSHSISPTHIACMPAQTNDVVNTLGPVKFPTPCPRAAASASATTL